MATFKIVESSISHIACMDNVEVTEPTFLTAGGGKHENSLALWQCVLSSAKGDEPTLTAEYNLESAVQDLAAIRGTSHAFVATHNGDLLLVDIRGASQFQVQTFARHSRQESVRCLALPRHHSESVLVALNGGGLQLYSTATASVERRFKSAANVNSLTHVSESVFLAGTSVGQLQLWDVRAANNQPLKCCYVNPRDWCSIQSIATHPGQLYAAAIGLNQGVVQLWDLRFALDPDRADAPIGQLDFLANGGPVWQVAFNSSLALQCGSSPSSLLIASEKLGLMCFSCDSWTADSLNAADSHEVENIFAFPYIHTFDASDNVLMAASTDNHLYSLATAFPMVTTA